MKLTLSFKAKKDLEEIWDYTSFRWSKKQADIYIKLIFNAFDWIKENFNKDEFYETNDAKFKKHRIKSHLIFYTLKKDSIRIERILHVKMDVHSRI